ncbi:helix-turn-helix domain-containing protein, partial [Mailhella sp.]|uniref:helix-turn-helix domain-containing protein n=1 Tax=Mailhella sp. TaxID=1981029 RepID=UPI00406450A1
MQSFEAVYARMLFAAGVRTQTELADILGIRQASISDAKKRKSIPSQWCMRLYDARGVRVDWQRHGVGPVYDEAKLVELEKIRALEWDWQDSLPPLDALREPDRQPLLTGTEGERPVYGTLMTAEGEFPEVGRQVFPQEFLRGDAQIFRLQHARMSPVLDRGALLAVGRGAPGGE